MIIEYKKDDIPKILNVINDAAMKYRGIIPDKCLTDPYMSEKELLLEFSRDFRMFGYRKNNILVGVMGVQKIKNVTLIRHAYTLTSHQRKGIGKSLLSYILDINKDDRLLVGTWRRAKWAIRFYEKFGFILHKKKQTVYFLEKYWNISLKQIENSVVLEK